ncbi:hypothetical protein C8R45DRAFT_1220741 [Mycena sanguinolenta]|nr:hypothetical protein C8R45DRAFT_1220741 [Mycena sanguinolenta]
MAASVSKSPLVLSRLLCFVHSTQILACIPPDSSIEGGHPQGEEKFGKTQVCPRWYSAQESLDDLDKTLSDEEDTDLRRTHKSRAQEFRQNYEELDERYAKTQRGSRDSDLKKDTKDLQKRLTKDRKKYSRSSEELKNKKKKDQANNQSNRAPGPLSAAPTISTGHYSPLSASSRSQPDLSPRSGFGQPGPYPVPLLEQRITNMTQIIRFHQGDIYLGCSIVFASLTSAAAHSDHLQAQLNPAPRIAPFRPRREEPLRGDNLLNGVTHQAVSMVLFLPFLRPLPQKSFGNHQRFAIWPPTTPASNCFGFFVESISCPAFPRRVPFAIQQPSILSNGFDGFLPSRSASALVGLNIELSSLAVTPGICAPRQSDEYTTPSALNPPPWTYPRRQQQSESTADNHRDRDSWSRRSSQSSKRDSIPGPSRESGW